jgi:DNA invertase Pin-like site-specific DNA recombinase
MTGTFLQVKYKLSKGSVLRVLHEAGTEVRRQPVGEAQVSAIIELYKSGLSIRQTAVTAGIPKTTVLNILARSGVAMRPAIRVPRSQ